ncbi:acyl carrier protein [Paraburkholderia fungorum]|uniref:acyl carrier protein n=1 Tax=Paraburkholderia fungorum TaxID=134537 RepID=UPI0038B9B695
MKHELKQYLQTHFLFEFNDQITEDSNLFEAGILDSFGYIHLIHHIEQQYDVRFGDDDVANASMTSLAQIVAVMIAKRTEAARDA